MKNCMLYFGKLCYVHVHMHVDDTDIAKIEQRAKKAEESVGQLKEERGKLSTEVAGLRKQLVAKDQTIESLRSQLRTLEIRVGNAAYVSMHCVCICIFTFSYNELFSSAVEIKGVLLGRKYLSKR